MRWGVIAVFCGVACTPGIGRAPLATGPRVVVARPVHHFGRVPIGEEVRHVFAVQNRGRDPLTLEVDRAECGCRVSVGGGGALAAGASGWIEVIFDTSGAPGDRVRTVSIETNDPAMPELVLALEGTVVADVRASPERVFFGRVPRGVAREKLVRIETAPGVSVRRVREASPRLAMRVERSTESPPALLLRVALRPQADAGTFDDTLVVVTDSERQPVVEIPVFGVVE